MPPRLPSGTSSRRAAKRRWPWQKSMIDDAKAATATEALQAGLVDFVVDNVDDLLEALNGFTVQVNNQPVTLNTAHATTEPLNMTFIEQFLMMLTNPNIVFTLLSIGTTALLIEISSPGGWVAGFVGVVCLALATYGMGILPVNWFGIIFMITAFVLFILDIKAPTHGALTTAGVASFIIGALVLFNSASVPQFQRVSVPLIVGFGIFLGLVFFGILMLGLRAMHTPAPHGDGIAGWENRDRPDPDRRDRRPGPGRLGIVDGRAPLRLRKDR